MRKSVTVNGRNIFVYRKGHENKHLSRTFVKHWKEGKTELPQNGKHSLQTDRSGKTRVFTNRSLDRRRIPHKKLGLRRNIHRKNYAQIRELLEKAMPQIFENQAIFQNVTITNQEYASKYKLRKDKIHVHPNIEHVLALGQDNSNAISSIGHFLQVVLRRIKVVHGLTNHDRIQLFMNTQKKPIKTSILKVGELIDDIEDHFLDKIEAVLQSQDGLAFDGNTIIEVLIIEMPHGSGRLYPLSNEDWNLKKCMVHIQNDDHMCAARAIVVCLSYLRDGASSSKYKNMKHCGRKEQSKAALDLHKRAQVPVSEHGAGLDDVEKLAFAAGCELNIVSWENNNEIVYTCTRGVAEKVYLHKHGNHFNAITKIHAFYNKQKYCHECKVGYDKNQYHRCKFSCRLCLSDCRSANQELHPCPQCHHTFKSKACFENHQKTVCNKWFECQRCHKLIDRDGGLVTPENHECYTRKCQSCKKWVDMNVHQCYLKKVDLPTPSNDYIFFDIEAMQDTGIHEANMVVAQYMNGEQYDFSNIEAFCQWLIHKQHKRYTVIAHYGKGYDFQFIVNYCLKHNVRYKCIYDGSKVMYLEVLHGLHLRFVDSFNFMTMPLKNMPSTFGLKELKKGHFAHLFNTKTNKTYRGELRPLGDYHLEAMSAPEQKVLRTWYAEQKESHHWKKKFWRNVLLHIDCKTQEPVEYDHRLELLAYCSSDVDILRRACLSFRQLFLGVAGCDPFQKITIASLCMSIYRAEHMPELHIAVVKENRQNFSKSSLEWLEYVSQTKGIPIRHACNGGEYQVGGKYFVDGYHEASKTVYQFHGCHWHGCTKCFQPETEHPERGKSMQQLYEETKSMTKKIRKLGFQVVEMWEHDWNKLKRDKEVKKYIEHVDSHAVTPLDPRDAFFGGRTDARKLYYKFKEGEVGKYVDICSLYPSVNYYDEYPVGHPACIKKDFKPLSEKPYFGFIKCKVIPPKNLYHPVLPKKQDGKLVFGLQPMVGTWCTPEIYKALEVGYQVERVYEVWHFEETSRDLFKSYVGKFLKLKAESSKDMTTEGSLYTKRNTKASGSISILIESKRTQG